MKKLLGSFALAAGVVLVACTETETITVPAPAVDAGGVVDAAPPRPARDAGPDAADASPVPSDTQTISPSELAIDKPFAPANQEGPYTATLDEGTLVDGSMTLLLEAGDGVTASSWAATTGIIPVDSSHKGTRYRMRVKVKTEGAGSAFAWFRIDSLTVLALDNMLPERAISGDTTWKEVSLVLDVPPKALRFAFGSGLKGAGRVWIGPITIESVDKTVPVTRR